ncbi:MAG: flavin reductase family protein [Acidobacteriota bacterium]|nr:flavin reductase family protein [Acidobacteriota bacterium]
MISSDEFRDVLRHFASGVTLVTARQGERIHGLTVSAFTSVSADPPLIAVVIDQRSALNAMLAEEEASFAVNLLGEDQQKLSDNFAFLPEGERFRDGQWIPSETGAPVLEDALAWAACRVVARHALGTHILYVGQVEQSRTPRAGHGPLVYWNRGYRTLAEGDD